MEIAGPSACRPLFVPVAEIALDVLTAFAGELQNGAARTRCAALVQYLIAGMASVDIRECLTDAPVEVDRRHRDFVNDVNHFLHVIEQVAQLHVLLPKLVIGVGGQQDVAEDDRKGAEIVDAFIANDMRAAILEADAAKCVRAVGNHAVGKSTEMERRHSGLVPVGSF